MLPRTTIRTARPSIHEYRAIAALTARAPADELCDFEFSSPWELRHFDNSIAAYGMPVKRYLAETPDMADTHGFAALFRPPWSTRDGHYWALVRVDPRARHNGLGSALCQRAIDELRRSGGRVLSLEVRASMTRAVAAAERLGFHEALRSVRMCLDTRTFDAAAHQRYLDRAAAAGIELVDLPELKRRNRRWLLHLHQLYVQISRDVPIPERPLITRAQLAKMLERLPSSLPEACFVALDGERLVGQSFMHSAPGERALQQQLTGVLPGYRGHGIAQALKLHTIAYARAHGFDSISTWVETTNTAMLAINGKFGFVEQPGAMSLMELALAP
jgi:ribosomal protein S18 acetylase RimI-like enzyme